jgi:signal transduction histidine kinase
MALTFATLLLMATHAVVELAIDRELDPLVFVTDGVTALVLILVFTVYLRRLARERRREVIEHMLLDILAIPRNIEATAAQTLVALRYNRLGDAVVISVVGEGDEPLRPLVASGYPRGWIEQAPPAGADSIPAEATIEHSKVLHPWLNAANPRIGKRPWVAQIPLLSGRDTLGLILVAGRKPGVLKDPVVRDLLSTRLGAAFDHAALYEAAYARERDLEDLEARRREFMAAIAHEIRTPLTSIQAFADLLQLGRQQMDETAGQLVASLGQGVQRLSVLVNDLIDLGRTGESAYPVEPRDVDLGGVIRSAEATLRPALMLREHSVTLDLPDVGPIAHADPRIMEQVVLNLLSNANRHSPAGGSIRISAFHGANGNVHMSFADDGPGIPEAERERIFQPYYRIRGDGTATVPGSGLGLAVARQLLDSSGGRIWVDESPNGGALFCVEVRAGTSGSTGSTGG